MTEFRDLKVGQVFATKAAIYEKIGYDKARVLQSALFSEGHEMYFELNFSVVPHLEKGEEIEHR